MPNSTSKELLLVKDLINEGKYEEALQYVKDLEQKENLTVEEALKNLKAKSRIYLRLGQFEICLKITEELYQKSQELKIPLFTLDALYIKASIFYQKQKFGEFLKFLEQSEILFKSIPRDNSIEFQEREAYKIWHKANRAWLNGNLNLTLDYCKKSIKLFEQVDPHHDMISNLLMGMSYTYDSKGELNLALECGEKTLNLIPKGENYYQMVLKSAIYRNMGNIYYQKGDLNKALEYRRLDLEILKKNEITTWRNGAYLSIISILVAIRDVDQAQNYLKEFKEFNEKHESKLGYNWYRIAQALILKSSSRLRDRVEAENILKQVVVDSPANDAALINLCDLYFKEFRLTNQVEILDDIYPLIEQLQRNAKYSNSYSLLTHVKLLQAKLALVQINMVEARKLLTEAQFIAGEHGLHLLAGAISREHDRLLEELKLWESFKKTQASVSERLKLASIDGVLERLQGRSAIEPSDIDEEPILLLIMDNSGATYFNHPFVANWDYSDLFSSFMSAFNMFMDEIFSKSIDRIRVGENTILINPIESFLACYVIKGQSYPALQKLTRFTEAIRENPEIWQALNKSVKTSEMLELDKPPELKSVINEIFT